VGEVVGTLSLLALLEEAVAAATAAEVLLTAWEDGAPLRPTDARTDLRLRVRFDRLQHWAEELELAPAEGEIRDETARLLSFYLHLLTHVLDARYPAAGRDRLALRLRGPLTGAPCARLATLRDRLRAAA
jgi:hypothetical protein